MAGFQVRSFGRRLLGMRAVSFQTCASAVTVVAVPSGPAAAVPPGSHALVANYGSDTVSLVDTAADTMRATVAVGSGPREVAVTPDGTHACVTISGGGTPVIETSTNAVVGTVGVGPDLGLGCHCGAR